MPGDAEAWHDLDAHSCHAEPLTDGDYRRQLVAMRSGSEVELGLALAVLTEGNAAALSGLVVQRGALW